MFFFLPILYSLVLISSHFFNTCYFDCWMRVVTTTTTLNGTFSSLGSFGVVIVKLTSLVLNMFYISVFLGHFSILCSTFEHIIQGYWTCILTSLTCCVLVPVIGFVDLIVAIHTTSTSFSHIYQVSRVWPVSP